MPRYKHRNGFEEPTQKEKEKETEVVHYPANENSTTTKQVVINNIIGSGVLARLDEVGKKNKVKVKLKT